MNKILKISLTIIGGAAVYKVGELSGCLRTVVKGLKHQEIRDIVAKELSKKISDYIYGKPEIAQNPTNSTSASYLNSMNRIPDNCYQTRKAAEEVLDKLLDILSVEGFIRISDYRMICGYPLMFTDDLYGWYTMTGWKVVRDIKNYDKYKILYTTPLPLRSYPESPTINT